MWAKEMHAVSASIGIRIEVPLEGCKGRTHAHSRSSTWSVGACLAVILYGHVY